MLTQGNLTFFFNFLNPHDRAMSICQSSHSGVSFTYQMTWDLNYFTGLRTIISVQYPPVENGLLPKVPCMHDTPSLGQSIDRCIKELVYND